MWFAGSSVRLEAVRWADVVCREFCHIRNIAMGRIGVQEVLSDYSRCDGPMWFAGSSVRLEILRWAELAYKKSCQITFDAMGRYGVEGVLSEPSIGPIGFV